MSGHCLLKICKDVYLQSLIEEEELSFELREEIVYQYDVAEELGVSLQFVSKIFSSSHYIL